MVPYTRDAIKLAIPNTIVDTCDGRDEYTFTSVYPHFPFSIWELGVYGQFYANSEIHESTQNIGTQKCLRN